MADAIGMIEVEGVAGIIVGADAAAKAATVDIAGWESIGGFTTLFVRGTTGDVDTAIQAGAEAARAVVDNVVTAQMHQPQPQAAEFIGFPLDASAVADAVGALGLVETRGYGAHIESNDAMVKEADVDIARVLTVHNRVVCTLITGSVDDVEQAIGVARKTLGGSEWFLGSAIIQQPLPAVLAAFVHANAPAGAS